MVDACAGTGLFPSVMMAQGILESGNGKSQLAAVYNNHFGIKCQCKACPCFLFRQFVALPTKEEVNGKTISIVDNFRSYKNTYDSFVDRINFLKENPRYRKQGVFEAKSPQEQTQALQNAGYATTKIYAKQLNDLIANYNLQSIDKLKSERRLTSNQTNYAIVGGIIIALTGYVYLIRNKLK
jgi:mannosyl-glycoprotein endo-beta-N-acetylglucosaminidase/stage II sporulation protein P